MINYNLIRKCSEKKEEMRTKAGETKRYSLRKIERRDFRSEEEVLASVCRESIKAYKQQNPDTPLWKHRQSISRRKKSIPKQNKKCSKLENIQQGSNIGGSIPTSITFPSVLQDDQGNSSNSIEENLDNDNEDNTSFNDDILSAIQSNKDYYYDNALLGDIMLNTALNHAIYCPASANCQVHECSRAKQFLIHWSTSTCIRESSYCQVCKSILMDLMVCTHVKTCEVSLFKCCPFPNCDKERVRVLGEWEKLKSKHKEMMDRTFGALKHVINCNNETCTCRSLKLVINISNLILHTRNCIKSDSCKSRKFVISLCEHHQKTCTDENCDVEFCLENRKEKELSKNKEQFSSQEQSVQESATSSNNNYRNILCQQQNQEGMPQTWTGMHVNQWNSNPSYKNFSADNSSISINSKFESIPSPPPFYNSNLQACNKDNDQLENKFSGEFSTIDATAIENTNDFKSNTYIFPESGIEKSQNDNFSDIDEHESDLCQSSTPIAASGNAFGGSNLSASSPTKEMYYKLWSGKIDSGKNVLPSLSPDDLKILSRATGSGDTRQLLSPVNDNRAAYSEISPYEPTTEFPALENSPLDDEFEEDPLYFPSCSNEANKTSTKTKSDDLFNLPACFNTQGSKLKRRYYTESLAEWGKIDFVRQQLMEEIDVETESADESDDEPDANMEKIPVIAPMSKLNTPLPKSKFNRQTKQDAKSPLTNFERSYLEIMNEKKQTVHAS